MTKVKIIVFFIFVFFFSKVFSQEITIFVEPFGEYSWADFRFPGHLDLGVKNVNHQTLYPKADFSAHFNPGFFIKANYRVISLKSGVSLYSYIFSLPTSLFPRGIAPQYDGKGNPRYYLGDGFVPRDEQIMFGLKKREIYLEINYGVSKHMAVGFLYHNANNSIFKDSNVEMHGAALDTLGSYVNHDHIINNYFLTTSFTYKITSFLIRINVKWSPYSSYQITYNHEKGKNNYDGYTYKLGAGLEWKSLFLEYYYSACFTKSDLFSNRAHTVRFGFSWEMLNLNIGKIDIFE
ncbi:MAG TPA: hypothetical protein ENK44_05830 [Caldithrix abyssi]|uniref:Type IX secretion system membrane protein PorP/SprF n=1 Tax=Caldithrix abyssi TaxID=187145 RepID=A0A7V4TZE3_CALAY|nr:hypothetical protein [Caldithrix abyssi]